MDGFPIAHHCEYQINKYDNTFYVMHAAHQKLPHLILHFDVNRTLISADVGQNQSPEDIIVNGLADQLEFQWDETISHPMNYTNYIKYHRFPNPSRSKEIKLKQKEQTTCFLQFLRENHHPLYPKAQELFNKAKQALEQKQTLIFPSFYKLLDYLQAKGVKYTLVFRTFGGDIQQVAAELNEKLGKGFLEDFGSFSKGTLSAKAGSNLNFYDYITEAGHHIAIQDDWPWWFKHDENYQFGKPFPIDLKDSTICSLFFDDNARLNPDHPEYNIVAAYDVQSGQMLSPEELIAKQRLFVVNTVDAICDENYFIDLIEQALQKEQ